MQTNTIQNETSIARDANEIKTAWHQPNVLRIDIKRTMSGASGSADLIAGTIPS